MSSSAPILSFDLGSPYAYLALERYRDVFPGAVVLEPILLGALFARRGSGSWAHTDARAGRIAELEVRARRYGLPPFSWPAGWPANGLQAMRAATWARDQRAGEAFALAVLRRQFRAGGDIADLSLLQDAATEAGLNPAALPGAIARDSVKQRLRATTERAWDAGVRGVPSVRIGARVFFGDDRLEEAAAAASARR